MIYFDSFWVTLYISRRQRMLSPARGGNNVSQLPGPSLNPFWWQSRLYPDSGIGGKLRILLFQTISKPRQKQFKIMGQIGFFVQAKIPCNLTCLAYFLTPC